MFGMQLRTVIQLLFLNIVEFYCYHKLLKTFYKRKPLFAEHRLYEVLLVTGMYIVFSAINMLETPLYNIAATFGYMFTWLFVVYEATFVRGIFYSIMYFVLCALAEALVAVLSGYTFGVTTDYDIVFTQIGALILSAAKILFIEFFCHLGSKEKDPKVDRLFYVFLSFPLACVILLYTFLMSGKAVTRGQLITLPEYFGSMIMILSCMLTFYAFEKYAQMSRERFKTNEEKMKIESDNDILAVAAKSMELRLADMETASERDRVMRHDRRHFEGLLLGMLQEGKSEEAERLLSERLAIEPRPSKKWCDNTTINATLDYYIKKAEVKDIKCDIAINIPRKLPFGDTDFAIAVGNLMENAIHANMHVPEEKRYISVKALAKTQLLFEISNPCAGKVRLNEEGYPYSDEEGHGIGTKSVLAFVAKSESEIFYTTEDDMFRVRMILPLKV